MLALGFPIALSIALAYLAGKFPYFCGGVLFPAWLLALFLLVMMTSDTPLAGVAWLLGLGSSYTAYSLASRPPRLTPENGMAVLDRLEAELNKHNSVCRAKMVDLRACLTPRDERRARRRNVALAGRIRVASDAYQDALSGARYMCPDALLEHLRKPGVTSVVRAVRPTLDNQ